MNYNLKDAVPLGELRRVLIIKLRHHGDVLTSSAVFSVLKAAAPHVEIDALVYADTADMLTLHPAIAQVHRIDRQWKKRGLFSHLAAERRLYGDLKARSYDLIVDLTEHWRGAWLARMLKPRWAVGPVVDGRGKLWKKSFTHLYGHPKNALRHVVEANLDALRRIGIQPALSERRMSLIPGVAAENVIEAHLARLGLSEKNFIHVHPASRWFFKCWPAEHMAGLIARLQGDGWRILLTAAPGAAERAMIDDIQAKLALPVDSLAGLLSLKELAALTARARLFIGVDSAPMHIAAAVGTPTVALFGPSGDRQWGPWGVPASIVASNRHPCRPCGIDGCGGGKVSDCLVTIEPEQVHRAVLELLGA